MPPPPSFIDVTAVPFSRVVTQAEFNGGTYGGVANEVWFRFPATGDAKLALGSFCSKGGTFTPKAQAYDADGSTFLRAEVVGDYAWYAIVDATTDKYIRILRSGAGATDFDFTVIVDTQLVDGAALEDGDFLENDDEGGPGVLMSRTGEFKTFLDLFPSGEYGALLPNGISLWDGDPHGAGRYELYDGIDYVLSLVGIVDQCNVCASDTDFFLVKHSGNPHTVYRVTDAGVVTNLGALPVLSPNVNITGFGCNRAGTVLYWTKQSGDAVVHQWDPATGLALSDLYTIPGFDTVADRVSLTEFNNGGEILCLPDDSLVLWWTDSSAGQKKILHLSSAGALLSSTAASPTALNHLAYLKDEADSVGAWHLTDDDPGIGRYGLYNVAGDVLSDAFDKVLFSEGVSQVEGDETLFGPATSCQFIRFPVAPTGALVVEKVAPDDPDRAFTIIAGGGLDPTSFALMDGETRAFDDLEPGTYSLAEMVPPGWEVSAIVSNDSPLEAITVDAGEEVRVTFTNTLAECECCVATQIRLVNEALLKLGHSQTIEALDDSTREATTSGLIWTSSLRAALRRFPWSFATKYARAEDDIAGYMNLVGGAASDPYNDDWTFAYRYPVDCLFARRLVNPGTKQGFDPDPYVWRVGRDEDGWIVFTDVEDAILEYTALIVCDDDFADDLFEDALTWLLASKLAPSLARNKMTSAECLQLFEDRIAVAATVNVKERQLDHPGEAEWIRNRE